MSILGTHIKAAASIPWQILRAIIEYERTFAVFARVFGKAGVEYGPDFIQPQNPTSGDPYAVDWQWTFVRRILVGGPSDGEDAGVCRRCYLPDSLQPAVGLRYRIGPYRDAATVMYVPA